MKKVFILIFFATFLISCGKTRQVETVDFVLKEELKELETLIMIQNRTKDTSTVKLIDSLKSVYKEDAFYTLGVLNAYKKRTYIGDLSEAIETTQKYIKLCEQ